MTRVGACALGAALALLAASPTRAETLPRFELPNWDGRPVSTASLAGTRTILAFTYAKCVFACPVVTRKLKDLDAAIDRPADLRYLHVSVNPTADTPEEILAHFEKHDIDPRRDPRWLFARGSAQQVAEVLELFDVEVTRRPAPGGVHVQHTIKVLVIDAAGEITATFDTYQWDRKEMRDALRP